MDFSKKLPDYNHLQHPIVLAIGNFDGVHIGHSYLINHMRSLTLNNGSVIILTFINNPKEIIQKIHVPILSSDLNHKRCVLQNKCVDRIIPILFTKEISNLTYIQFITLLRQKIPFDHLVFGEGESLGKNLEGTPLNMQTLSLTLDFSLHYIPKIKNEKKTISSTSIRKLLFSGKIKEANILLGYNFSIAITKNNTKIDTALLQPGRYTINLINNSFMTNEIIELSNEGTIIAPKLIDHLQKNPLTIEFIEKIQ